MTVERALLGTADSSTENYIENMFSAYLYTGNGSTQTITNGVNLSANGGLVWLKQRAGGPSNQSHYLFDTSRGINVSISSDTTAAQVTRTAALTAFNNNGFDLGSYNETNRSSVPVTTYAAWTFRKKVNFFDVVTYTGNGSARTINHSLGSAPGCIIVKCTSTTGNWAVYHRSQTSASYYTKLNLTDAQASDTTVWNGTAPTSSDFSVGTSALTNANGATYVAYLFAHDAGGFGDTGTENVISCGSYTGNGSATGPTVTLGYEPQCVIVKALSGTRNWVLEDVMRGMSVTESAELFANAQDTETAVNPGIIPTATGFRLGTINTDLNASAITYIYIAIRRGPMKTPTVGTTVFSPIISNSVTGTKLTTGFPVDLQILGIRTPSGNNGHVADRLRGVSCNSTDSGRMSITNSQAAETSTSQPTLFWDNTGFQMPINYSSSSDVFWSWRRAPGFFDVVCYAGTGSVTTVNHNLGAVPQMLITKSRSGTANWQVYLAPVGATKSAVLNSSIAPATSSTYYNDTSPTASVFTLGTSTQLNASGSNYVAYLFASCSGVSQVGTYTGTGAAQVINCGFTSGARFILIKRTSSTGDWFVWDSARGITSGNDPYLLMNSSAAEITSTNYVNANVNGFEITSSAPAILNANGSTFVYLAIA